VKLYNHVQPKTEEGIRFQCHVVSLDLHPANESDAGSYECQVKPFGGAAVAAVVNFTYDVPAAGKISTSASDFTISSN